MFPIYDRRKTEFQRSLEKTTPRSEAERFSYSRGLRYRGVVAKGDHVARGDGDFQHSTLRVYPHVAGGP